MIEQEQDIFKKFDVLKNLRQDGWKLKNHPKLKNNKEAALIAVKQNGWALQYASDELKNDKEFISDVAKIICFK